jgi:2,3-bisphosphoglycerate-independent phosphoglycerate mutase
MENSYQDGVTDEFIKPIVMLDEAQKPLGTIKEDDVVICFNFRTDRLRELTFVLTQKDMPEFQMKKMPLYYVTMANYDESFTGIHILYEKDNVFNSLGEVLANHGRAQLRIAETEKYPHVTFFFSGGREATFSGEERIMVSSPKVATYDLQPEMSAPEVTEKVIAQINTEKFDFICLNFANCDMVGHTGIYEAIIKAIETVDSSVKQVINAAIGHGYTAIVTADHGNSDFAINADGSPNTEHSLNQVPCILISDSIKNISDGVLADLAPTILKILHIPIPAEMTAKALV